MHNNESKAVQCVCVCVCVCVCLAQAVWVGVFVRADHVWRRVRWEGGSRYANISEAISKRITRPNMSNRGGREGEGGGGRGREGG